MAKDSSEWTSFKTYAAPLSERFLKRMLPEKVQDVGEYIAKTLCSSSLRINQLNRVLKCGTDAPKHRLLLCISHLHLYDGRNWI